MTPYVEPEEPGTSPIFGERRQESGKPVEKSGEGVKKKKNQSKRWWGVWKRWKDGEESDWWFASTGIPLLAATLGPLANVSSIAALVTSWRQTNIIDGERVSEFDGVPFSDPKW
jgi:potassium channel subfamily K